MGFSDRMRERLNRLADLLVHPTIGVGSGRFSGFQVCGVAGALAATVLITTFGVPLGLDERFLVALPVAAVLTFLSLAMATKVLSGTERLVAYHHQVAVVAVAALLLRLGSRPLLPYLDLTVLGLGLFLSFGRVGCLMAGCCHGRVSSPGVRSSHAGGSERYLPVQAVEAAWLAAVVAVGCAMLLRGAPPGAVLAWYSIAYACARFATEFGRGDVRPFVAGLSEAQWTSAALAVAVVAAELAGLLPAVRWHATAAVLLALVVVAAVVRAAARQRAMVHEPA
jgi:hypothetical protein